MGQGARRGTVWAAKMGVSCLERGGDSDEQGSRCLHLVCVR